MSLLIWVGLSTKSPYGDSQSPSTPTFPNHPDSVTEIRVPSNSLSQMGRRIRPVLSALLAERCCGNQELYSAPGIASFPGWKSISSVHPLTELEQLAIQLYSHFYTLVWPVLSEDQEPKTLRMAAYEQMIKYPGCLFV